MTLTLTATSWPFAVQVTDRLLTTRGKAFDRDANKNIVFHGLDGIIAIAYSGTAYIRGKPTDQWIVETITGEDLGPPDKLSTVYTISEKRLPRVGHAIRLVGEAFNVECDRRPGKVGRERFELYAVGYQATHNSWTWFRPFTGGFARDPGDSAVTYFAGRRWFRHPFFQQGVSPAPNVSFFDFAELQSATRDSESALDVAEKYVQSIQAAATRTPVIGSDCLSVEIDYPSLGKPEVRIRFHPGVDRKIETPRRRVPQPSNALAFSPWVIGPSMMLAPAIISAEGWLSIPLGRYEARIRGTDVMGPDTVMFIGRHERETFPPKPKSKPAGPTLLEIIDRELKKAGPPKRAG